MLRRSIQKQIGCDQTKGVSVRAAADGIIGADFTAALTDTPLLTDINVKNFRVVVYSTRFASLPLTSDPP